MAEKRVSHGIHLYTSWRASSWWQCWFPITLYKWEGLPRRISLRHAILSILTTLAKKYKVLQLLLIYVIHNLCLILYLDTTMHPALFIRCSHLTSYCDKIMHCRHHIWSACICTSMSMLAMRTWLFGYAFLKIVLGFWLIVSILYDFWPFPGSMGHDKWALPKR